MKKILVLKPAYTAQGGISNYYKKLENKFTLDVEYLTRGARTWPVHKGFLFESFRFLSDIIKFIIKLLSNRFSVVQTSTSLGKFSLLRDGIFIILAKLFNSI